VHHRIGFRTADRRLAVSAASNRFGLGDKIHLIPGNCDPTDNLNDRNICVRGNRGAGLADPRPRHSALRCNS
jgi:hypothetical protein